ncbi:helix-turn-helix domain-containing protein [Salinisphaera sp. SPP-AMP-43]|uniref:helix-turn-helix domain-containing protein n=1 Tax=Salinisphaera sp. SPP-AMP-43 TaxID=3121288 RepID=UPI003C6DD952
MSSTDKTIALDGIAYCPEAASAQTSAQIATASSHGNCGACVFKTHCLPAELDGEPLRRFEHQIWRGSRPVKAGHILIRQGDPIDSLFALRVGSLKAYVDEADGTERVLTFRFPGAIIGLAEPYQRQWSRSFAALEDSWLCRIPLSTINDTLRCQLIRLMSDCLRREYEAHLTLALNSGTRKVVSFLLELSGVFAALGQSPIHLRLPMNYLDVASYLGMRHESISRTLAQLQKQGLVRKHGKDIHIDDLEGLQRIKGENGTARPPTFEMLSRASSRFGRSESLSDASHMPRTGTPPR